MKAFIGAVIAVFVIGAVAAVILNSLDMSSAQIFSSSSVRL